MLRFGGEESDILIPCDPLLWAILKIDVLEDSFCMQASVGRLRNRTCEAMRTGHFLVDAIRIVLRSGIS